MFEHNINQSIFETFLSQKNLLSVGIEKNPTTCKHITFCKILNVKLGIPKTYNYKIFICEYNSYPLQMQEFLPALLKWPMNILLSTKRKIKPQRGQRFNFSCMLNHIKFLDKRRLVEKTSIVFRTNQGNYLLNNILQLTLCASSNAILIGDALWLIMF